MGQLQVLKQGWSRLDATIDEIGADGLMSHILWKLSEGCHPSEIAGEFDLPWVVLKKWIESDPARVSEFELGRRALADKLAWDSLGEARDATIETVALSKYRSDTYFKGAAIHNRREYGNERDVQGAAFGAGGITIVIGTVESPYLAQPTPASTLQHTPTTIEHEPTSV